MDSACDTEDSDEDASEESMVEDSDSSEREEESVCDDSEAAELVTEVAIVASASILDDIWSLLTLPAGKRTVGSSNGGVSFGIGPVGAAKPLGRGASSRRK